MENVIVKWRWRVIVGGDIYTYHLKWPQLGCLVAFWPWSIIEFENFVR